jgi:NAD(P) transhydrogenase subunit alpha
MESTILIFLIFILVLSIFLGFEIISKVPSLLHTPLMSGSNAISGVTVVGAMLAAGLAKGIGHNDTAAVMGGIAIMLATINVVGGYFVTDRMLQMFRKKESKKAGK